MYQSNNGGKLKQLKYPCYKDFLFKRQQMKQIFSILANLINHSNFDLLGQGVRHKNAKYQLLWFFGNSFQIQSIKEKCTEKYNETLEVSQIASTDLCQTFRLSLISRYSIFCMMA